MRFNKCEPYQPPEVTKLLNEWDDEDDRSNRGVVTLRMPREVIGTARISGNIDRDYYCPEHNTRLRYGRCGDCDSPFDDEDYPIFHDKW